MGSHMKAHAMTIRLSLLKPVAAARKCFRRFRPDAGSDKALCPYPRCLW